MLYAAIQNTTASITRSLCDPDKDNSDIRFNTGQKPDAEFKNGYSSNLVYEIVAHENEGSSILNVVYTASRIFKDNNFAHIDCIRIAKLILNVDTAMIGTSCSGKTVLTRLLFETLQARKLTRSER